MNWVEVVWPIVASVSLVFGLVHLLIWGMRRSERAHLSLAIAAFSLAVLAVLERMALFSPSTMQTATLIRWMHVPVVVLIAALLLAVHVALGHGSVWLAGSVMATRLLALVLNFTTGVNLNFLRVDDIQWTTWWGVAVAHPVGPPNPALVVALISNLLLMIYLVQTLLRGLRLQPGRQRALFVICGSCMLLTGLLIGATLAWALQLPRIPLTLPGVLVLLLAVGWQLGGDLIRWSRLEELLRHTGPDAANPRAPSSRADIGGMSSPTPARMSELGQQHGEDVQLRAVLESSPTALLLVDRNRAVAYANERARSMFGYAANELMGVDIDTLLPHSLLSNPSAKRSGAGNGESMGRRRGGSDFPVDVALSPLQMQAQHYTVAAVSDLSERRSLERELAVERESMAHMSRVVLVGEISGSLAHELNQPLAAILSNAQAAQRILRRDPTELGDIREILDDIVDNDRRAGEVIRRLRGLLKKEYRVFAPLSVSELVQDSLRVIRNDLISRGVEYRMDLPANVARVKGDHVQLQQVLLNLIINACDAMGDSGPRVLTIRTSTPRKHHVQVEVRDTGPGIPEDMLDSIFAPFQSSKPNGMGMGLAICRTIIRAHGGRIWAANVSTGGASVCFELPQLE